MFCESMHSELKKTVETIFETNDKIITVVEEIKLIRFSRWMRNKST